jgi:hypothetical protein
VFVERAEADVTLRVVLNQAGKGWHLRLELLDEKDTPLGTRDLESVGTDCAALTDVLPVVIALLLDASREHVRLTLPEPSYHPEVTPTEAPRILESPPLPRAPDPIWHWGWVITADGTWGLLPGAVPGGSLVGRVETPHFRVPFEIWIGALAPTSTDEDAGATFTLMHTGAALCPAVVRGAVRGALCGGAAIELLRSSGIGYDVVRQANRVTSDIRASFQLDIPFAEPFFARFELGAISPITRHRYFGESEPGVKTQLHRPAVIAPRAGIGIGVGFW